MDIVNDCRYIYSRPDRCGQGGIDGIRYGSLTAISMADAKAHVAWLCRYEKKYYPLTSKLNGFSIRKACLFDLVTVADNGSQVVRKAIFDGARTVDDLDAKAPGWRDELPEWSP